MRIKNRRRFISAITILGLIILFITILTKQTYSNTELQTRTIYVSNGETLWSIACEEQENNQYYNGKKIKDILEDIRFINNLNNTYIYEGQKLEIPTL